MASDLRARVWNSTSGKWMRTHLPVLRSYEGRIVDLKMQRSQLRQRLDEFGADRNSDVEPWDVVEEIRFRTSAQSMTQILTPTTSAYMPTRKELECFPVAVTVRYKTLSHEMVLPHTASLPTLDQLEAHLARAPRVADVVYVDPWHTYDDTIRVLELGLRNVAKGGWLLCHDCLPRDEAFVTPEPSRLNAAWCGETWRAFYDVAKSLPQGSRAFLVDSGVGTGVLRPSQTVHEPRSVPSATPEGLDAIAGWRWFIENVESLIEVVSAERWRQDPAAVVKG